MSAGPGQRRLAVVGAGWAGLAAAVQAVQQGWQVKLFEMAQQPGGRARSVSSQHRLVDNGQHILIGAYRQTLALMRSVGVDLQQALQRRPLALCFPDGSGLRLPTGAPLPSLLRGIVGAQGWTWRDKAALLRAASRWWAAGFHCAPALTVAQLTQALPAAVQRALIEPLCVAALNTPAAQASASVFLRVLQDALFAGQGSADLLLPRQPLSALLPGPALAWLRQRGAAVHLGHRVQTINPVPGQGWQVDGRDAGAVLLACSASQAAQLTQALAPAWSAQARALRYEPIITGWLHDATLRLPQPMLALREQTQAPAQFIFDLGALGQAPGLFSLVVSGAASWVERGLPATGQALLAQARAAFPGHFGSDAALQHIAAERRATFACTPALQRPPPWLAPGLVAAGDYIAGPYPATLEGAVRSGQSAVELLQQA